MGRYESIEVEEMVSTAMEVVARRGCDFARDREAWSFLNEPNRSGLRDAVFRGLGLELVECSKTGNYHVFAYEDSRFAIGRADLREEFDRFSLKSEDGRKVSGAAMASLVFLFLVEKLFGRRNGVEQNFLEYDDFMSYVGERMGELRDADSEGEQSDIALLANAYIAYDVFDKKGDTDKKRESLSTVRVRRTKAGIINSLVNLLRRHGLVDDDSWESKGRIVPTERFREFGPKQLFAMSRIEEINAIFEEYPYAENE